MRTIHILGILVLLALAVPVSPVHAGGVVTVCDEAHLLAALVGGGTVTFACSGTITLTAEIAIAADTSIDGSGQAVTISGNNAVRLFTVHSGVEFNLDNMTVANGTAGLGGGIFNGGGTLAVSNSTFLGNSSGFGGGILNGGGTVIVSSSTFSGNSAYEAGGAIYSYDGTLTVHNSTFSGNYTNCDYQCLGGGIYNNTGTLTVSDSNFQDNHANGQNADGGGIYNGGTLTVSDSTFSENSAPTGGGISNDDHSSTVTLKNTIIANSATGGNCSGPITDGGGNLSYPDTTCPGLNAAILWSALCNTMAALPGP